MREATGVGLKESKDIVEGTIKCPPMNYDQMTQLSKELVHYGITQFIVQGMPTIPLAM